MRTCCSDRDLRSDLEQAIYNPPDIQSLLQVWAEGADLSSVLPSSENGETALHIACLRENGASLHMVDFLIQNMTAHGLNKQTNPSPIPEIPGCNTALHLCAMHDRRECLKLLLRSGADFEIKNAQNKTALDVAKECDNDACAELVRFTFFKVGVAWQRD